MLLLRKHNQGNDLNIKITFLPKQSLSIHNFPAWTVRIILITALG